MLAQCEGGGERKRLKEGDVRKGRKFKMSRTPCDSEYQMHSPCVRLRLLCAVPCEYGGLDDRVVSQVSQFRIFFRRYLRKFLEDGGDAAVGSIYIR